MAQIRVRCRGDKRCSNDCARRPEPFRKIEHAMPLRCEHDHVLDRVEETLSCCWRGPGGSSAGLH